MNTPIIAPPASYSPDYKSAPPAPRVPSARAPSKVAGPVGSLDPAACSLPVSSVESFCARWEAKIADGLQREERCAARGDSAQAECIALNASARKTVIDDLRAELGRWTVPPAGQPPALRCAEFVRLLGAAELEYRAAIIEYEKAEAEGVSSFWEHNAASYKKGICDSYRKLLKSEANESESQQIDQIICELKKREECAHAAFVYEKDANIRLEKEIKRLRDVLCAIAAASGFDNIGNWARSEAKKALWPNAQGLT